MLEKIKKSYKDGQLKATVSVNSEMLRFYYSLGEEIISLKAESRWGSGFYKKLSSDLQKAIPNVKGFSVTNLKYMKKFYEMYSPLNRPQLVDDLRISKVSGHFDIIFNIPESVLSSTFFDLLTLSLLKNDKEKTVNRFDLLFLINCFLLNCYLASLTYF